MLGNYTNTKKVFKITGKKNGEYIGPLNVPVKPYHCTLSADWDTGKEGHLVVECKGLRTKEWRPFPVGAAYVVHYRKGKKVAASLHESKKDIETQKDVKGNKIGKIFFGNYINKSTTFRAAGKKMNVEKIFEKKLKKFHHIWDEEWQTGSGESVTMQKIGKEPKIKRVMPFSDYAIYILYYKDGKEVSVALTNN